VVVSLVALATGGTGSAAGQAAAPKQTADPCALPDRLLAAGETKLARKEYVLLLRRDPGESCAREGLAKANKPADNTATEVTKLCDTGDAKRDAHRDEAALKNYEAALDKDHTASCASDGIASVTPKWLSRSLDSVADAIPKALVGLGLALATFFLFACLMSQRGARRILGPLPLVGRIFKPQLNLKALEDKPLGEAGAGVGVAVTARIKERLHRFREQAISEEAYDQELDLGTVGDDFADLVSEVGGLQEAIGKAGELNEHTKAVTALLTLFYGLMPTTRMTVSGVIEPPSDSSTTATVSLENGARLEAAFTVSGPVSATPAKGRDFIALAQPAAVWIQYEVANALSKDSQVHPDAPESYGLTQEAIEHQLHGRHHEAHALYERAIELYSRNWAAHVGRATAESRLKLFRRAESSLERSLRDMRAIGAPA
jgi:tetratricopeptide (TPR) repeat protein